MWTKANRWVYIDPISGVINTFTSVTDFTLTYTGENYGGFEQQDDDLPSPMPIIMFGIIIVTLLATAIFAPHDNRNSISSRRY